MKVRLSADSPRRRWAIALALYIASSSVFAVVAGPQRLTEHTAFNHYALMANAWLHGRLDLPGGPPAYSQNNDFAEFDGKTYISFPPFPAVLMLPFVKLAGSPENFRDGQFVIWLAGLGPALLFLVLEKLRRTGQARRSEQENMVFALLFAFGTVYFFTAVEGTVWFAALVVGVALEAAYVLFSLGAERPALAGAALACAYMTRPPMLLAAPLFALEAFRACSDDVERDSARPLVERHSARPLVERHSARPLVERDSARPLAEATHDDTFVAWLASTWGRIDKRKLATKYVAFAMPIIVAFAINSLLNHARYRNFSPFDPGHEYLTVAWRGRMMKWGVLSYHFLSKNLGVMLTILPWFGPHSRLASPFDAPFQINEHGLALWFTTPLYLWLFYPRRSDRLSAAVLASVVLPMAMDLLYQNTGWRQFGYRFSCDYAILLFVLLALGDRPMGGWFKLAALWSVGWNLFGAVTFDKTAFDRFYFREGSQTVLYQPD